MDKFIISTNPGKNYEVNGKVKASTKEEIAKAVESANRAKEQWGSLSLVDRVNYIKKIFQAFKNKESEISETITKEIGTPITECKDEVSWDWGYFEWFIDNATQAISPEITFQDKDSIHQVLYEPVGSVAVITPWNLPFDLFIWGVIPNLLVGNTVIYKAAEQCALTGKLFEDIVKSVGLPKGVFQSIHGNGEEGKYLVEQDIDMVWFTGSSEVGRSIYELAGKKFIKCVLEMGGSNPVIVFEDADLDLAVNGILSKRFMFSGQTCDADKRLIIHELIYEKFLEKFKTKVESMVIGNPDNPKTQMGPLVSDKQLKLFVEQIKDAIEKGAKVVTGGVRPKVLKGAYFLPTVLTNVKKDMRVWNEEVFGPLLPVVTFKTDEEAVNLANDTVYGLGSQIFTKNEERIDRVIKQLKAGNVDVNACGHFKPFNPFGGYKNSGMGREHGIAGFRELCQIKTVSIKK